MGVNSETRSRRILRWLLAFVYFAAGVAHVRSPADFLKITPDWVPFPHEVVFITGLCEVAGAIALLMPFLPLRRAAGIAFAAYAVCVYPANIKHALDGISIAGQTQSWWYHAPRLAFQPVFVWWALYVGGLINWPFTKQAPHQMQ